MELSTGDRVPSEMRRRGVKLQRERRRGANWGCVSSEREGEERSDWKAGEEAISGGTLRLLVLAGNENGYKIEDGFLSRTSTTQLKHHYHRQHRHVHLQVFRWHPLRRRRARCRHRSVLPSSVVPGQRQLTRRVGQGLKRGSDAESVSLSQPDAPIDDATVHAEVLNLVTGLLGGLLGGGGLGLRSVTDDTAIGQFPRLLPFHGNTG